MAALDIAWARSQFPALAVQVNGRPAVYFDGPGGTQVPQRVIDAMRDYLMNSSANTHGAFLTSRRSDEVIAGAHAAVADLLGCDADEVIFGPNMTTLTFSLSRALGREFGPGDELVVTGQKIWTSYAHLADWQELLVRTDPELPKHKGITWVICDMQSPGIDVRPIHTMDNGEDFCEVFYDEVRIPVANVVGGMNNGWSVAMSTLSFERGTAFTIDQVQLSSTVERLIDLARDRSLLGDDEIAHSLARARADVAALRALTYLGISRNLRSPEPGPEGSMLKLQWADLNKRIMRLAVEILGATSLAYNEEGEDIWSELFLLSYGISIGGGTSEIQRNIIAERVLGLPR